MNGENKIEIGTWKFSKYALSEHRHIIRLVEKNINELKLFGDIRSEKHNAFGLKGGRPIREYILNEPQSLFLCTLLPNTNRALEFKIKILKHIFCNEKLDLSNDVSSFKYKRNGYVYVINRKRLIKIGSSINPTNRIKNIAAHYPDKIKEYYISPLVHDCFKIEREMHSRFKDKNYYGEWFDVELNDAVNEIKNHIEDFIDIGGCLVDRNEKDTYLKYQKK